MLDLRCFVWAFCTFGERELLGVAVCGLLIEAALLLWTVGSSGSGCGSQALGHRLNSYGAWA